MGGLSGASGGGANLNHLSRLMGDGVYLITIAIVSFPVPHSTGFNQHHLSAAPHLAGHAESLLQRHQGADTIYVVC